MINGQTRQILQDLTRVSQFKVKFVDAFLTHRSITKEYLDRAQRVAAYNRDNMMASDMFLRSLRAVNGWIVDFRKIDERSCHRASVRELKKFNASS